MTKTYKQKLQEVASILDPSICVSASAKNAKREFTYIIKELSAKIIVMEMELKAAHKINVLLINTPAVSSEILLVKAENAKLKIRVLELESYIEVFGE